MTPFRLTYITPGESPKTLPFPTYDDAFSHVIGQMEADHEARGEPQISRTATIYQHVEAVYEVVSIFTYTVGKPKNINIRAGPGASHTVDTHAPYNISPD